MLARNLKAGGHQDKHIKFWHLLDLRVSQDLRFEHTYHGIKKNPPRTWNCHQKSAFGNFHGGPGCPADPAEVVVSWSATRTPIPHAPGVRMTRFHKLPRIIPRYSMVFHVIPSPFKWIHVIQCDSLWFHNIPCYAKLLHAIPRYSMILCYSTLFHVIPSYSTVFHAIPSYSMVFHTIPCYSAWFHVIPCYSTVFHVIPCYSRSQLLAHKESKLINPRRAYQLRTVCVARSHLIVSP